MVFLLSATSEKFDRQVHVFRYKNSIIIIIIILIIIIIKLF